MSEIALTQGKIAVIDDADAALIENYSWCASRGRTCYYAVAKVGGTLTKMHRFLLGLKSGDPEVDHKDGDGLNNHRGNLRLATASQNGGNSVGRPNRRKSKYKGVLWRRRHDRPAGGYWCAVIVVNRKQIVRYAPSELGAARTYNELASQHFGEFARLNMLEVG